MGMRVQRSAIGLGIAGLGLVLAGAAIWILSSDAGAADATQASDFSAVPANVAFDAPALKLKDIDGAERALSDYAGQVVLVNLWATWCPPCAAEMPILQRFFDRHRKNGFTVVAIEDGDPEQEVRSFIGARGLTFPVLLDPTYQATDHVFKTGNLPSSYVVDRGGTVRLMWFGAISEANLEKYVTPLIKE